MVWSRLRSLFNRSFRRFSRHQRPPIKLRPYHLRMEVLEERWLLTTVTNLLDDGSAGSLRGAILATPTGGTVDFDPTLSSGTIRLTSAMGALTINKDLTISGPSSISIAVSGRETPAGTQVQVFNIGTGFNVNISNLTITEGQASEGAGIDNHGNLILTNSTITGNAAAGNGGGIWSSGTLTATNDTISANQATGTGNGGGIFSSGTLNLNNVTVAGNTAAGGSGGGVFLAGGGTANLKNTIVATNTAPTGPDISGAVSSALNNLVGNGTGSTGVVNGTNGNLVGTAGSPINPRLGTLQNNGGPTATQALLTGSPAIDAGTNTGVPATDQRGFSRTVNTTTDMGAYEFQPPATTTTVASGTNPSTLNQQVTFTATVSGNAPGSNTPTGTVTFFDGSTLLGTGTLAASGTQGRATATFTISTLTVGNHSITASYNGVTIGDFHFDVSTSGPLNQVVNRGVTTTALVNAPNPSTVNQTVTFTATVTPAIPGTPAPSGSVTFMEGSQVLGNAFLTGNTATFTISTLMAATHSNITAHYNGDGNYAESTSNAVTQTVNPATTTTTLVISPNPATVGQTVTFTATVTPSTSGTLVPTGTVTFRDGGTILGTGTLSGNTATITSSTLTVGTHPITANYNGDVNFLASASASQNLVVSLVGTTTTLVSSPNPSTANQPVTFTATVTPASGTANPTGTVTFTEGGTVLGTGTLNGTTATLTIANLTAAGSPHLVTAHYNGDTTFDQSISTAVSQVVTPGATMTVVVGNPNPVPENAPVTFTATVTPSTAGPLSATGTVTFLEGSTVLGTGTVGSDHTATLTTSFLRGVHTITARYNGDTNFNTSSGTVSEVVQAPNPAATTTTLNSSPNPSTVNQAITFTATVTAQSGTPTGTVTFREGTTVLGTGTLSAGSTSIMVSNLPAGTHTITATYNGDVSFATSTSSPRTQTVNQVGTTTTLGPLSPSTVGQPVTFTATVTPGTPGPLVPSGTVTFFDGANVLGTGTVSNGTAMFTTSTLTAGTHPITAHYNGDVNFAGSTSSAQNQVVNRVGTTVILQGVPNPSSVNQTITFTATVTPNSGTGTPTGTVTFREGNTILGTGTLSGRIASITVSNLSAGPHTITATYSGDTTFAPPDTPPSITQTVNKGDTTTSLASSPNPSRQNNFVTFTATVAAVTSGFFAPTGTVGFLDGTTVLGTATLISGPGGILTATFSTTFTTTGTHTITARYSSDTNFNASTSNAVSQVVNPPSMTTTTTTLTAGTPNPSTVNQSVTFTATVTPSSGSNNPTGNVTLLDGTTVVGVGTLSGRTATIQVSNLSAGTHTLTARYDGDDNFITSTSSSQTQTVNRANTTTALVSSMNPAMVGQTVTFTATVTPGMAGTLVPSGTVTFLDGTTVLGTGTLTAGTGGTFTATFTTSGLIAGSHPITARYEGDTNFNTSTSSVVNQVIGQGTTTNLVSSMNPSGQNQPVTFTATVMPTQGTGTPTGTVTFLDGTNIIGTGTLTNGTTTFTFSFTTTGTHPITARYNGDTTFSQSTSSVVNQVVNPGVMVTVTGNPNPSGLNQAVTFTATVAPVPPGTGTPTGTVTFLDGTNIIGTGTLTNGMTSVMFTFTTTGTHVITARYSGDSTFGPGSGMVNQIVSQPTSTALTSSLNPSGSNQAVTFTATVTATPPGTGIPNGTVTFLDGTTILGTGTLANGIATFTTSTLTVGTHSITARYNPADGTFLTSTSTAVSQVVHQFGVNAMVAGNPNPSTQGQQVTFTATITAIGTTTQTPTGSVVFMEGVTILGTGTLSGTGGTATATIPPISTLAPGVHVITITYSGDTNFGSGTATVNQIVNPPGTTTSTSLLTSAPNPSAFGQSVTFTATVTGTGGTPTGTVTFLEGNTVLGMGTLTLVGGTPTATFTTMTLSIGSHMVVARYSGDATFASSTSAPVNQVVSQPTSTTMVSSLNPSAVNQSVTFTATVASQGTTQAPTGTVTFLEGTTVLGTGALTAGTGGTATATFTTSTLALGSHTLTARYNPADNTFLTSTSSALTQQVVQFQANITSVTGTPNPSNVGQQVTFTVTIMGQGTTQSPTGTVTFREGTTLLGTATVTGTGSTVTATFMFTFTTMATHMIAVTYNGDTNFSAANGSVNQVVGNPNTTTTLVSSINPSGVSQAVTFTATVTPSMGTVSPTGTVTFLDGTTILGTGTLTGVTGGTATTTFMFTFTSPAAIHPITARYNGDATFGTSTSMVLNQDVRPFFVTVTVAGNPNPSNPGQQVTFTATVTGNTTSQTPTGSVVFREGTTILGTGMLSGTGGTATATFQTSTLSNGSHTITASYGGDTNFGSGMNTVTQVVGATTTTALTSSLNFAVSGRAITFTATVTVTSGTGTPTGTVTFLDGTTVLGTGALNTSRVATFTTSTLSIGLHTITARYEGDSTFGGSTSTPPLQELVRSGALFAIGGSPGRVQVRRTSDGSLIADFAPFGASYTGPVTVAIGDIEGNGMEDVVVGAGVNQPHVKIYRGSAFINGTFDQTNPDGGTQLITSFFAFGTIWNVGTNVAVGNVTGDIHADLIVGAAQGNPHVKVYKGASIANGTFGTNPEANVVAAYFAYTINVNLGANVAAGDVTKSGFADVITAASAQNPHVKVYSGQAIANGTFGSNPEANVRASFFAFGTNLGIGAFVSFGITTSSGFGDIIVGEGGNDSQVKVYSGQAIANGTFDPNSPLDQFFAFQAGVQGTTVGGVVFNHDLNNFDIITGQAQTTPRYRIVAANSTGRLPPAVMNIDVTLTSPFQGGVNVGGN